MAGDLEPLPPGGEADGDAASPATPPAPQRHRRLSRRRRRQVLAAVLVVVVAVIAGAAVQNVADSHATRRAMAVLDTYEGANYLLDVDSAWAGQHMVPDDRPIVDAGLARQERAQAAGYARLEHRLGHSRFLDGSTRHLIASLRALLRARIADLDALAAWRLRPPASRGPQPPDPSPASNAAAVRALAAAARHAGHPTPVQNGPIPSLDVDLTRWSDAPTGTLLAVSDGNGVQLVDIDASSAVDLQMTGTTEPVVARAGYVAAVTPAGAAVAKAPAVPAPLTELGLAGQILPAVQLDAVWLVAAGPDTTTGLPTTTVTEVDGNGRRLAGPARVPDGETVTGGVTAEGLVVTAGGGRLAVWDPASGHQRLATAAPASLLAASGDLLAWQPQDDTVIDVTDLRTGTTSSVQLPQGNMIVPATDVAATTCALSPEGGRLACPVLVLPRRGAVADPYHLAVIGLGGGSVRVSAAAVSRENPHPLVWAADGSRLWAIVPTEQGSLLATWPSGAPSARELRFRVQDALSGLAVVSG